MEIIKIKIKTSLLDARALEREKSSVKVGGGRFARKKARILVLVSIRCRNDTIDLYRWLANR